MKSFSLVLCASILASTVAFFANRVINTRPTTDIRMATVEKTISSYEAPDFYWKFRLDRLVKKKGDDLAFAEKNYDVSGYKDLYDAYYLDLTLQGKLEGFDWEAEKSVSDSEWQTIYKTIAEWSTTTAKENKPDTKSLPSNDFDLLKQFYPQLNFRDLETPFVPEEVGSNFPYSNMKEMIEAAGTGSFSVPGYSGSTTSLEASEAKAQLNALKEKSMAQLDAIYEDALKYANSPFPDDDAKKHYKALKEKLAGFPSDEAGWQKLRSTMEKEVDEMARLASKKVDHHHNKGEMSPAEEFEAKYGRSLEEMQERMNEFKADPQGFLEKSIIDKYGKNGLDIWKKSQEFADKLSVMSDADKAATESKFTDFLNQV